VTGRPHRAGGRAADRSAVLFEAPRRGADAWPAIDAEVGSVMLVRSVAGEPGRRDAVWSAELGSLRARCVFDWMTARPDHWTLWARMAHFFGGAALDGVVIEGAERDAEQAAAKQEMERLRAEEQRRLHERVDLFVLDQKNKRPGLSLESGDENKPFFVMNFSERWERERVLDWLRWQKPRFQEFRALLEAEGAIVLERLIIAGMRETEADVKRRGLGSGGRRPLRFWRGE
jgi:hypothetical protein